MSTKKDGDGGFLDFVERVGNLLPDPATLFLGGAILVLFLSWLGSSMGWTVEQTVQATVREAVVDTSTGEPVTTLATRPGRVETAIIDPETGEPSRTPVTTAVIDPATGDVQRELTTREITVNNLLSPSGINNIFQSMASVFMNFPPLGVVLLAMLGIGVAEKTGCISALLKAIMLVTPSMLLTPVTVFAGVMSSMAVDAGYVVLPPLAAALYKAVGRSPLVGLAAVFSGVGAGFSANLFPTGLDPLLSGLSQAGAQIMDPSAQVNPLCNYYFMIVSTFLLTALGWFVTAKIVEPRFSRKSSDDGGPSPLTAEDEAQRHLAPHEARGLTISAIATLIGLGLAVSLVVIPGAPLNGTTPGSPFPKWTGAIVPLLFILFLIPGIAYGVVTGAIKTESGQERVDAGIATLMGRTMADMGPYIVLAFFAAHFVQFFNDSNLGLMLAIKGGEALAAANLPAPILVSLFVLVVAASNMFIGSASAKYAFFAPVFVPMLMQVEFSPALVQAAYRVGDSASNIVAPMNPYIIILLVFMRRYVPKAGIGTLVSLMLPYALVFLFAWIVLLVVWMLAGVPLGVDGALYIDSALPGAEG